MADHPHRIVGRYRAALGEGPLWDHRCSRLIWCDILGKRLLVSEHGNANAAELDFAEGITAIGLAGESHYIATSHRRLLILDADFEVFWSTSETESALPDNRFNDGKVDPLGRFWAGTMHKQCEGESGSFYLFDQHGLRHLGGGFGCTNGPAFSPDGKWVLFTDSNEGTIYRNPLSADQSLDRDGSFIQFEPDEGSPDGMTFDCEGRLYVSHFAGSKISRFLSDGSLDRQFYLPALNITSVAFGGSDLATLFATSAHCTFAAEELRDRPCEGAMFAMSVSVCGMPEPVFTPPEGLI